MEAVQDEESLVVGEEQVSPALTLFPWAATILSAEEELILHHLCRTTGLVRVWSLGERPIW